MNAQDAVNQLLAVAQRRTQQAFNCKQYQSIVDRPMLELRDATLFDSVEVAHKNYQDADKEVKRLSKVTFDALPSSLQFALRVLEKKLLVGATQTFDGKIEYTLSVKQAINDEGKPIKDEFTYDVEPAD